MDAVEDFSISFAQVENTTCSDTHEMIRLQNGIAETSCACKNEMADKKFSTACRKHSEITQLDMHCRGKTAALQFQVMSGTRYIDSTI